MAFAAPLKNMLTTLGVPHENLWGDGKETPLAMFGGKSAREAMQKLGTEWGRESFGPTFWTDIWKKDYCELTNTHRNVENFGVVVDDVRFDSECLAIREMGGIVIEIRRPTLEITGMKYEHSSEAGVRNSSVDYVIWNDKTPGHFRDKIDVFMWQEFGLENNQGQLV